MGGYDLYGNYYQSSQEALNAEYAQMAQIDADIACRHLEELQMQAGDLNEWRQAVEQRLALLETFMPISLCAGEGK